MRVTGQIVIERPPEQVFDFVADERNEPQYNPRMVRAEKLTPGPIGVGTKFNSVMTGMGRSSEMTIEFTEFDRPRRIAETTHLSNMDIGGVLLFEPVPEGTRMKWIWNLDPRGFYRSLGPLVRRMGERQERAIWTRLKRVVEGVDGTNPQEDSDGYLG